MEKLNLENKYRKIKEIINNKEADHNRTISCKRQALEDVKSLEYLQYLGKVK